MSPEQESWRGERARQLMEEPLIKDALGAIEAKVIEEWRAAPVKDVDLRERLWLMYNMAHAFRNAMREHIETGKLATVQIRERNAAAKFRDLFRAHP